MWRVPSCGGEKTRKVRAVTEDPCGCLLCELAPKMAIALRLPLWCVQCPAASARTLAKMNPPKSVEPCSWCGGTGFVDVTPCRECSGVGRKLG